MIKKRTSKEQGIIFYCNCCFESLLYSQYLTREKFWKFCPFCGEPLEWSRLEEKENCK